MSEVQQKAGSTASKVEQSVKLRPTLYIGVGGTGMEVMMCASSYPECQLGQ